MSEWSMYDKASEGKPNNNIIADDARVVSLSWIVH